MSELLELGAIYIGTGVVAYYIIEFINYIDFRSSRENWGCVSGFFYAPCLIPRTLGHSGDSVHTSLVTTFTCSVPLSGALFRHMCPYPGLFRITASFSPCPVVHIPLTKCIIGKNVQIFFWWSEFLLSDAPLLQVIIAGTSRKTGAEIKKLSHLPANIFQISRSAPPLLHTSTRNDVFLITLYAATYWKNGIHDNAGNGIVLLAYAISSIGRNKKWKKNPSNEGEKTEVQLNNRHKKTRLLIGLFCAFQPWVGGSGWRRTLFNQHRHNMSTWYGMQPYPLMRIIRWLVLNRYNSSLPARIKRF